MALTRITLVFRDRSIEQVNEICSKLRSRAAEMGGFQDLSVLAEVERVTEPPLILPPRQPNEGEEHYSHRVAAFRREQRDKTLNRPPIDSAATKFARVFGGDGN